MWTATDYRLINQGYRWPGEPEAQWFTTLEAAREAAIAQSLFHYTIDEWRADKNGIKRPVRIQQTCRS